MHDLEMQRVRFLADISHDGRTRRLQHDLESLSRLEKGDKLSPEQAAYFHELPTAIRHMTDLGELARSMRFADPAAEGVDVVTRAVEHLRGVHGVELSAPWTSGDLIRELQKVAQNQPSGTSDYRPASWFGEKLAARLRKAASPKRIGKRVRTLTVDGVVLYSVDDARSWWARDLPSGA